MGIKVGMVTLDTTDSRALAVWWCERLGGRLEAYGDLGRLVDPESADADGAFFIVYTPESVPLGFQQVADPTPGENRLHLDLGCSDRAMEVAKMTAAGATILYEMPAWTTLADPDGNQFCISSLV